MLKIVATITNFGAALNIGGDPVRESMIIDVPTNNIPEKLKKYLDANLAKRKYETLSFSILNEDA